MILSPNKLTRSLAKNPTCLHRTSKLIILYYRAKHAHNKMHDHLSFLNYLCLAHPDFRGEPLRILSRSYIWQEREPGSTGSKGKGAGGGGGGALDETKTQDKVREGVPVEESSFWK